MYEQENYYSAGINFSGVRGYQMSPLISMITAEFERSIHLIESLDDEQYKRTANGTGSVGGHVRHNLDFINGFLTGVAEGLIDYGRRERDVRIEVDRPFAITAIEFAIERLNAIDAEMIEQRVVVRSEIDGDLWHTSSISRELEFVQSHTVHHHALIAEKLRGMGFELAADFGVAPSTLKFWAESSEFLSEAC